MVFRKISKYPTVFPQKKFRNQSHLEPLSYIYKGPHNAIRICVQAGLMEYALCPCQGWLQEFNRVLSHKSGNNYGLRKHNV